MNRIASSVAVVVAISVGVNGIIGHAQQTTVATTQITKDVRKRLTSLPYYGVFDLLTFQVDTNGVVSLGGYVLNNSLKKDAEREAREVKGVTEVQNRIAIASGGVMDDDIRHGVYHAIYGDSALSRYGTPESQFASLRPRLRPWGAGFGGRRLGGRTVGGPTFGSPRWMNEPFWGYDPVGDYAIHILVNNRVVTLAGVVDSEGDKTLAGLKTRGVTCVSELNNDLQVGKP
jgi:osmotically-inducible protein OsmY